MFIGSYRNLNSRSASDAWSQVNVHLSKDNNVIKDKLYDHATEYGLTGPIYTTNESSIAKGCIRIKAKSREVCAVIAGNLSQAKPAGNPIGRITLDLDLGYLVLVANDGSRSRFDPASAATVWFSDYAWVYTN